MFWINKYILIVWGGIILPGCCKTVSNQQNSITSEKELQEIEMNSKDISQLPGAVATKPEQDLTRIAPGTCRIVGKVSRILLALEDDKNIPCGKVPCKALVQVQKVIGYGTAFTRPLAANQEIKVYFSFTLNATEKKFPELTSPLPGLKVGDLFLTDLQSITGHQAGEGDWYKVNLYKIL